MMNKKMFLLCNFACHADEYVIIKNNGFELFLSYIVIFRAKRYI